MARRLKVPAPPQISGVTLPWHSDWAWRADVFTAPRPVPVLPYGGVSSFHDGAAGHVAVLSAPGRRAPAALALRVDAAFDGSYVSVIFDLPDAAAKGLGAGHLVRADVAFQARPAAAVYARLNLAQGPNTTQILRRLDSGTMAEFDMTETGPAFTGADRLWLDLIFERPPEGEIVLDDLVFSRRPRLGF